MNAGRAEMHALAYKTIEEFCLQQATMEPTMEPPTIVVGAAYGFVRVAVHVGWRVTCYLSPEDAEMFAQKLTAAAAEARVGGTIGVEVGL
jgi:alkanesulfonate monooxygenase SsuD/methylene tetrahydromethanopterin reductase-like flavin-dependent oxidoreductase (luciferase family)